MPSYYEPPLNILQHRPLPPAPLHQHHQIPLSLSNQPTNRIVYQTVGPKNLPVADGLGFGTLTAVSMLSMLLFATLTPHQEGMEVFVRLRARMMTMVAMARPTSRPAEVM